MNTDEPRFFYKEFDFEGTLTTNERTDDIELVLADGRVLDLEEILLYHLDERVRIKLTKL